MTKITLAKRYKMFEKMILRVLWQWWLRQYRCTYSTRVVKSKEACSSVLSLQRDFLSLPPLLAALNQIAGNPSCCHRIGYCIMCFAAVKDARAGEDCTPTYFSC